MSQKKECVVHVKIKYVELVNLNEMILTLHGLVLEILATDPDNIADIGLPLTLSEEDAGWLDSKINVSGDTMIESKYYIPHMHTLNPMSALAGHHCRCIFLNMLPGAA